MLVCELQQSFQKLPQVLIMIEVVSENAGGIVTGKIAASSLLQVGGYFFKCRFNADKGAVFAPVDKVQMSVFLAKSSGSLYYFFVTECGQACIAVFFKSVGNGGAYAVPGWHQHRQEDITKKPGQDFSSGGEFALNLVQDAVITQLAFFFLRRCMICVGPAVLYDCDVGNVPDIFS